MRRLRTVKPKRRIPHSDSPFSKGQQPGCTTNTEADNKKMPIWDTRNNSLKLSSVSCWHSHQAKLFKLTYPYQPTK